MQLLVRLLNRKTGVKTAAILLVVTLLILTLATMTTGAPGVMLGDVNDDGEIDVRDVVWVMQYILDLRDLTEGQQKAADVNVDGEINVLDVTLIMQHILGITDIAKVIASVEEVEITVPYGTTVDLIEFPETVTATLQDDTEVEVDVEWEDTSDPAYQPLSANDYTFKGELVDLPLGVSNPEEIEATAVVTVAPLDIPPRRPPVTPPDGLFTLSLLSNPLNGGVLSGAGDYEEGQEVNISATANPGYVFSFWSADAGSFVYEFDADTVYTMPAQNITVTANFVVGGISVVSASDLVYSSPPDSVYNSAADYVYSTDWVFEFTEVGFESGQEVIIDLNEASENLEYVEDASYYDVSGFNVDFSNVQDDTNPHIVLTATADVDVGTAVTITVYVIVTEAVEPDDEFDVIFIRDDTGMFDSATFGIESPE